MTSINDVTQFYGKIDLLPLCHTWSQISNPLPKFRHKIMIITSPSKGSDYCLQKQVWHHLPNSYVSCERDTAGINCSLSAMLWPVQQRRWWCTHGAQPQTRCTSGCGRIIELHTSGISLGRMMGQTDGRTQDHVRDSASYTMRAVSITEEKPVHHHHHHLRISSRRKSWTKLQGRYVSRITLQL